MLTLLLAFAMSEPLAQAITAQYEQAKRLLLEAVRALPDSAFLSKSAEGTAAVVRRAAVSVSGYCADLNGALPPDTRSVLSLETRTDLARALDQAFAACDPVLRGATDSRLLQECRLGTRTVLPVRAALGLIAEVNRVYGMLAAQLQSNGITPPHERSHTYRIPEGRTTPDAAAGPERK